ncbi:MAG: iron-containing redox enzyme family protein [Frankia sp.]
MDGPDPYAGLRDRDYFHIMLNLDSFDGFLPTARSLAERWLQTARTLLMNVDLGPDLRPFPYSKAAYEARLDAVYQRMVGDADRYEAERAWENRTREDVVEWILQLAPFNQSDGCWLRGIAPVGPIDEVRALLFSIYVDELGGGDPDLNHPSMYTELLRSVGFDLPDIRSRAYADNPALLDSAFTQPLFQLVVSQFPQDFFPELLGMTQYLEWSSVGLREMVLLHKHFGLDPHFYEMHVAIDNAATGHGEKARRAVELYLEQIRVEAGDEAMREQWERVWTGYVAFATTGGIATDMAARHRPPSSPVEKVTALIRDRAPRARLNHGRKVLAGTLLNELFDDPDKLLKALVDGGMIVPGDPGRSPFFDLLGAEGPMYRVFTDADIETWKEWARSLTGSAPVAPPPGTSAAAGGPGSGGPA